MILRVAMDSAVERSILWPGCKWSNEPEIEADQQATGTKVQEDSFEVWDEPPRATTGNEATSFGVSVAVGAAGVEAASLSGGSRVGSREGNPRGKALSSVSENVHQ